VAYWPLADASLTQADFNRQVKISNKTQFIKRKWMTYTHKCLNHHPIWSDWNQTSVFWQSLLNIAYSCCSFHSLLSHPIIHYPLYADMHCLLSPSHCQDDRQLTPYFLFIFHWVHWRTGDKGGHTERSEDSIFFLLGSVHLVLNECLICWHSNYIPHVSFADIAITGCSVHIIFQLFLNQDG